jgi:hypothetical protein
VENLIPVDTNVLFFVIQFRTTILIAQVDVKNLDRLVALILALCNAGKTVDPAEKR